MPSLLDFDLVVSVSCRRNYSFKSTSVAMNNAIKKLQLCRITCHLTILIYVCTLLTGRTIPFMIPWAMLVSFI